MKYGKTLVVRMSTSSPDFQTIFRDECVPGLDNSEKMSAFFPLDAIIEGGKRLHEDAWADRYVLWINDSLSNIIYKSGYLYSISICL